jgi:NAD(P)-dependent dehydrogenase (short-subunit alcohol dehydrogenase family)
LHSLLLPAFWQTHLIQQNGGEAVFVKTDVAQAGEVEALIAKAVATYGRLDCAYNNAGIEGSARRPATMPKSPGIA